MNLKIIRRKIKNKLAGYCSAEILARKATCNDENNPSTELKAELARLTRDHVKMLKIMKVVKKRLDDLKRPQHVHKAIKLVDYLCRYGGKGVIEVTNDWHCIISCLADYKFDMESNYFKQRISNAAQELLQKLQVWRGRNILTYAQLLIESEGESQSSCKSFGVKSVGE
ncbi:hypothetical protein QYM36_019000 [Artemia franciscana]|uniref:ENTH domain-containing protein n=1 Tax=Artemia franciscana TaxID=6661 RepID=A0AA88KU39_ARTSF|nr:hypothetical protein QYM36_019000 [Artemia franciscana]